ncbi:hypothetical protein ACH4F6_14555 [Streptomyces sp. NPDC017936]|uniref:hypothetical protein n=1 Tax=Streptomyces sp. NPDC017936 TaxID=3365016 RepID=UPI0037A34E1F
MSEQTPSQAEGERPKDRRGDDDAPTSGRRDVPRTTPSQAEGDDPAAEGASEEDSEQWQAGWSGP